MIERYTIKEIGDIWSDNYKQSLWLKVEISIIEALYKKGIVTKDEFDNIIKNSSTTPEEIKNIEKTSKHDVIAFLTVLENKIGKDSRWIHYGVTSSDILDTSFALQLKKSGELILEKMLILLENLKIKAFKYKDTPMIGRSHAIHAEPTTLGLMFASWYKEIERDIKRLKDGIENISTGQISGAVGTFSHLDPDIEEYVCKKLGLTYEPISTQVISRDRHLQYFYSLVSIATSLEKFAINIRHMQRTELKELEEFFSKGQKGSSAMPHKRNPISSENVTGLSRVIKSYFFTALENTPLWHERDLAHSSSERIIAPDSTILTYYIVNRFNKIIENLVIYPENLKKNLNIHKGLIYSQAILLELTKKGVERQKSYKLVQKHAMDCFENGKYFKKIILEDKEILNYLTKEEIEKVFDLKHHLRNIDKIFKRVF